MKGDHTITLIRVLGKLFVRIILSLLMRHWRRNQSSLSIRHSCHKLLIVFGLRSEFIGSVVPLLLSVVTFLPMRCLVSHFIHQVSHSLVSAFRSSSVMPFMVMFSWKKIGQPCLRRCSLPGSDGPTY